jgi:inhibitor of KinA sporulation pathway (predicted exonuclease)
MSALIESTHAYLVVDLEATCDDQDSIPRAESEIIEIGAVVVDPAALVPLAEFQTFVRPQRHPRLTPFCTRLTSITQAQVDNAPRFPEALARLDEFIRPHRPVRFCSWGDYDRNQLSRDAARHGVRLPLGQEHVNLKEAFRRAAGDAKKLGTGQALTRVGLRFEGTAHRGIDDARDIAHLLPYILGRVAIPPA